MDGERWQAVERLFAEALDRSSTSRRSWLEERCRDDPALAAEVESLLEADERLAAGGGEEPALAATEDGATLRGAGGSYRLRQRLGEGGTSVVYLAEIEATAAAAGGAGSDPSPGDAVAVKVLRRHADPRLVERFAVEVEVLARLDHPGIARLVDAGTTAGGRPFVVTRFVEGEPIDRYCGRHALPLAARLRLFVAVCEAVSEAHRRLVIHRDLKPSNILVTADGRPVLLDFGLARLFGSPQAFAEGAQATRTGERMLTWSCASPEQVRGEPLTTATDVYGLGVLLYQLLVGAAPFVAWHDRPAELARAICEVEPELPSRAVAGGTEEGWGRRLRGDLDAIVAAALAKRPGRRYPSVDRLAEDVRRHLGGLPVRARPAGVAYRLGKLLRRHRLAAATSAALGLGLLVASLTAVVQERRMAVERDRAEASFDLLVDMLRIADPALGGGSLTAREFLDRGAERIDRELAGQPELQGRLFEAVGTVYLSLGVLDQAERSLTRAWELRRRTAGESPGRELAESLEHLGTLRQEQGRHAEAEALFRRALTQLEAVAGADDPAVAGARRWLADSLRDQAAYAEAEPLYRQALATYRRQLGPTHREVAETINSLGMLHHDRGDLEGAEARYREALDLWRRLAAGDQPEVSSTLQNLAAVLRQERRFDEAASLFEEALAMARRMYGADNTNVGVILQNLGLLYLDREDLEAARSAFARALEIDRASLGEDHPNYATNVYHLGLVEERSGDLAAAEARFREAIDRYRRSLGPDHPWLGFPLLGLGLALLADGRAADAEPQLARAVAIRRAALGDGHWRVAEAESALGACLAALGRRREAEPLLRRGLAVLAAELRADDPRLREAAERLGELAPAPPAG